MSDEMEKIAITVSDTRGSCTRIVTDEYEVFDTCWPHLVEVFLEQLQGLGYKFMTTPEEMVDVLKEYHQGLGYKFMTTPEEMVDVLEEYHQELMCAECGGCEEEKPTVEEKKYPYTGVAKDERGRTVVEFTNPNTGTCIYVEGHRHTIGEYCSDWAESLFEKVSK